MGPEGWPEQRTAKEETSRRALIGAPMNVYTGAATSNRRALDGATLAGDQR